MTLSDDQWNDLLQRAHAGADRAYAPFSRFPVGAALLCADGRIITGCNVENSSYPLGICAERVALASAIAAGQREFRALALSVPGPELGSPCGACRQVLAEFCQDLPVMVEARASGCRKLHALSLLLPDPFRLQVD